MFTIAGASTPFEPHSEQELPGFAWHQRVTWPGDDVFALPRVLVSQSNHLGHFLVKLTTGYEDRHR